MFELCSKINDRCAFCCENKGFYYCGISKESGVNRIDLMKGCPKIKNEEKKVKARR